MHKYFTLLLLLFSNLSFAKSNNSDLHLSANAEQGCSVKIDGFYDFGEINFTNPDTPQHIHKYATHKDMPFDLTVQCSKNTTYTVSYDVEEKPALNSDIIIIGIILRNTNQDVIDFLASYIYLPEYDRNLHNIVYSRTTVDGLPFTHKWFLGLQNPVARGYPIPQWGTYKGFSNLKITY
jgi:hypothetical protein